MAFTTGNKINSNFHTKYEDRYLQEIEKILFKIYSRGDRREFDINKTSNEVRSLVNSKMKEVNDFLKINNYFFTLVCDSEINSFIFASKINFRRIVLLAAMNNHFCEDENPLVRELHREIGGDYGNAINRIPFEIDFIFNKDKVNDFVKISLGLMALMGESSFKSHELTIRVDIDVFEKLKQENQWLDQFIKDREFKEFCFNYFLKTAGFKNPINCVDDFIVGIEYLFFYKGKRRNDLGKIISGIRTQFRTWKVRHSDDIKQVNFNLKEKTKKQLDAMSERLGLNKTEIMEFILSRSEKYKFETDIRNYLDAKSSMSD